MDMERKKAMAIRLGLKFSKAIRGGNNNIPIPIRQDTVLGIAFLPTLDDIRFKKSYNDLSKIIKRAEQQKTKERLAI